MGLWLLVVRKTHFGSISQYGEYKRSDIRLLRLIHCEIMKKWDWVLERYVTFDCEQTIFFAEVLRGDDRGKMVTVVSYQGPDAPEVRISAIPDRNRSLIVRQRWKDSFRHYSGDL